MRVYHLCEAHHAISNIQKSRLKVATFADANDPFELSVFYSRDPAQRLRLKQYTDDVAILDGSSGSESVTAPQLHRASTIKKSSNCF